MKKFIVVVALLLVAGCKGFTAGDFPENRQRLYTIGNEEAYCQQHPDRCVNGVPW